jgi:hypothetical protein
LLVLLPGETRAELGFAHPMFARVAPTTRWQDVLDPIRTSARQGYAMIRLQRPELFAICAAASVGSHQLHPLIWRERTLRRKLQGSVLLRLRSDDRRIAAVIFGDARFNNSAWRA